MLDAAGSREIGKLLLCRYGMVRRLVDRRHGGRGSRAARGGLKGARDVAASSDLDEKRGWGRGHAAVVFGL